MKSLLFISKLLAASIAGWLAASASAAVLVSYTFADSTDATSSVPLNIGVTTLSIGVDGTEFGVGTGHGWSTASVTNGSGAAASSPVRFVRPSGLAANQSDALTNNDYFEFTVTPDSGYQVSYSSLDFDIASSSSASSGNTASWFLRSSADSYTSNIGITATVSQPSGSTTSAFSHFSLDFGVGYEDLSTPVTFRLYTYSTASGVPGTVNRIDNITLNGDIASIPEPTPFTAFISGGLLLTFALRRRNSPSARL